MPPLPIIDAKKFIKFLESLNYQFVRQKGSHKRYKNPNGKSITIPDHGKDNLKRGLLNGMLNELNISVEELIEFINKL